MMTGHSGGKSEKSISLRGATWIEYITISGFSIFSKFKWLNYGLDFDDIIWLRYWWDLGKISQDAVQIQIMHSLNWTFLPFQTKEIGVDLNILHNSKLSVLLLSSAEGRGPDSKVWYLYGWYMIETLQMYQLDMI